MLNSDLRDKVALVTGASRGIGRQIAIQLAGHGAKVIVNYCGSKGAAKEVVDTIVNTGGTAEAIRCDVSDFSATKEMIQQIMDKYELLKDIISFLQQGIL